MPPVSKRKVTPPFVRPIAKTPRYLTKVYTKDEWYTGEWVLQPYLYPVNLNEKSLHANTSCTLMFDFGINKREDETTKIHEMPVDVVGKFVCIRVAPDPPPAPPLIGEYTLWTGFIPRESLDVLGVKHDPNFGNPEPSGEQTITARGLEYLLDKRRLVYVPVVPAGQSGSPDPPFQLVNVIPTFNDRRKSGASFRGNKSLWKIIQTGPPTIPDTFAFSDDGNVWNYVDVIEFALTWSDDWVSNIEPHFVLSGDTDLLDYLATVVPEGIVADDRSILSLIRALIDQRRGIDASLKFSVDNEGFPSGDVEISLYSTTDVDVSQNGRTLPANPNQVDMSVSGEVGESLSIDLDSIQQYDEIVIQGEPMVVVFTAAGPKAMLQNGPNDEVSYYANKWANLSPAWSESRLDDFNAANFSTRKLPIYDRVLRRFTLSGKNVFSDDYSGTPFDWETENAFGESPACLHPEVHADGSHTVADVPDANITAKNSPFGNVSMKMLRELPLTHVAEVEQEQRDVLFEKPMAFCLEQVEFGSAITGPSEGDVWFPAHEPPAPSQSYDDVDDAPERPDVSARITVSDRDLEFDINFTQGAQALGYGDMTPDEAGDEGPMPAFDWRWMVMTLAVETDYRPSITIQGAGNGQKKLVLRVKGAHYWLAPSGAVVHGVSSAGKLLMYNGPWADRTADLPDDFPSEGILRNDMPRLVDVALLASAWYSRKRSTLTVTRTGILDIFQVGTWVRSLLQDIQRSDVGTVVTGRVFDFRKQKTTIHTGIFGIDPRL